MTTKTEPAMRRDIVETKDPESKAALGPGPWLDEPDRVEWRYGSFPCLITRARVTGALCGYVGLSDGHPWFGMHYDDIEAVVHGGLTYASPCEGHICHVPRDGESDHIHWIGFDCSHHMDVMPGMNALRAKLPSQLAQVHEELAPVYGQLFPERYRDVAWVMKEVEQLADQAELAARDLVTPPR